MSTVACRNINKLYDNGFHAVKDLNLEIEDGEFIVLLGPSGCGKSTTLMMLAGLESISSGELLMNDLVVNDLTPRDRDIGMVFQNYALFPNLDVYDNIAYGLTVRKEDPKTIDEKVMKAAKLLGLEEYLDRRPASLSGGQRQRVAIGRTIVRNPSVFLFDEPLSNLDARLRAEMRNEIIHLHQRLKTTIVYVTHDQIEAMTMADRIVVMRDGDVLQIDTPTAIYDAPADIFVATFVGSPKMNLIEVDLVKNSNKCCIVMPDGSTIELPEKYQVPLANRPEGKIIMGIRPQYVNPIKDGESGMIKAAIHLVEITGTKRNIYMNYFDNEMIARENDKRNFERGEQEFTIKLEKILLFDKETSKLICH